MTTNHPLNVVHSKIRIIGDRQTGKTELVLAAASRWIEHGQKIMFLTRDWNYVRHQLSRFTEYVTSDMQVYTSNGNEHVTHISGGGIWFVSVGSKKWSFVDGYEVIIVDDIESGDVDWAFPDSARVIRTYL